MAKIIAIIGKICVGKSTLARELADERSALILSTDELVRSVFTDDLGERHDEITSRVRAYLLGKAVELTRLGCDVILDWGFWTHESRRELAEFCREHEVALERHYVDVNVATWELNIRERNERILRGEGGYDYYLDEGLREKLLSRWEAPTEDEVDFTFFLRRRP